MIFRRGVNRELKPSLRMFLELAEGLSGVQFTITDAVRVGGTGPHGEAQAVDIACVTSTRRHKILKGLRGAGFHRIGIYDRHIHVDRSLTRPAEVTWLGKSR